MNSRHLGSMEMASTPEHCGGGERIWLPNTYEEQRNLPAPHVCQVFSRPGREILRLDSVGTQCSEGGSVPLL